LIGWYTALSVASLEPFGPSSGSVSKPVKPPGFGVEGVDVGLPDTNSSKEYPFVLTDCDVDDCVICDQDDNTVCLMCSESATAKWRSADGSDCVSACDSSDVKIHTADRGYWCTDCSSTNERECKEFCSDYRWDVASSTCMFGCTLPSSFGRNTDVGTCVADAELSSSESCTAECTNDAIISSVSGDLTYSCDDAGDTLTAPSARCETIWDHVLVDGEDWGELYREANDDWIEEECSSLTSREISMTSYTVIETALSALGLTSSAFTTLACDSGAVFPSEPRFWITTTSNFEIVSDKVTLDSPIIYFDKSSGHWDVFMVSATNFVMPDALSSSESMYTMGRFETNSGTWTMRTGALSSWTEPFGYEWLEISGFLTSYEFQDGTLSSNIHMWANCTTTFASIELEGAFSYDYGAMTEPNLVVVELQQATIDTLMAIVENAENLSEQPLVLRDLFLTEALAVVASDADNAAISLDYLDISHVDAGMTLVTKAKLIDESRLEEAMWCTGAQDQFFEIHYFMSDDGSTTNLNIHHSSNIAMTEQWTVTNVTLIGDSSTSELVLDITAHMYMEFSNNGFFDLPLSGSYDGSDTPVLTTSVETVDNMLGYAGVQLSNVEGTFIFDASTDICTCYFTGDMELANAGTVPMRGLSSSDKSKHSYWQAVATLDSLSLGSDVVPWWNSVHEQYTIEDDDDLLADMVIDEVTLTIATSASDDVNFPTSDDGSTLATRAFPRGWVMIGEQVQLVDHTISVEMTYTSSVTAALPSFVVTFDSDAVDTYVDFARSTYLANTEDDYAGVYELSEEEQQNVSMALHVGWDDWADTSLVPQVINVEVPSINLETLTNVAAEDQHIDITMHVKWFSTDYYFDAPVEFADLSSDYVADFLSSLAFQCISNDDCSSSAPVCSHEIVDGALDVTAATQTWHCIDSCSSSDIFEMNSLGCFEVFAVGDTCDWDVPCGDDGKVCLDGICSVQWSNDETCTVDTASYCASQFCCEGCANTCQDYPLEAGFNCSTTLDFHDCASDWCSFEEGVEDPYAVCLALLEDGDTCDKSKHCVSEYCSTIQSDICVTQYDIGESCSLDDDCISGLGCCWECGFICETYPRDLHVSCINDEDCESEFCSSSTYTCAEVVEDGEECLGDDACTSGFCSDDQGGICFTQLEDGEACTYASDCTSSLCSSDQGNECFTILSDGEVCIHDSDCESGWCTDESFYQATTASVTTCQTKYATGETCGNNDNVCESNDCSADCAWFSCNCV
jgi:hypothetical protein